MSANLKAAACSVNFKSANTELWRFIPPLKTQRGQSTRPANLKRRSNFYRSTYITCLLAGPQISKWRPTLSNILVQPLRRPSNLNRPIKPFQLPFVSRRSAIPQITTNPADILTPMPLVPPTLPNIKLPQSNQGRHHRTHPQPTTKAPCNPYPMP
jgi:hypothetical protein